MDSADSAPLIRRSVIVSPSAEAHQTSGDTTAPTVPTESERRDFLKVRSFVLALAYCSLLSGLRRFPFASIVYLCRLRGLAVAQRWQRAEPDAAGSGARLRHPRSQPPLLRGRTHHIGSADQPVRPPITRRAVYRKQDLMNKCN